MAANDIFLYAGEANPNNIVLADPTVQRPTGGGSADHQLVDAGLVGRGLISAGLIG